jgi:hypothetical protein
MQHAVRFDPDVGATVDENVGDIGTSEEMLEERR